MDDSTASKEGPLHLLDIPTVFISERIAIGTWRQSFAIFLTQMESSKQVQTLLLEIAVRNEQLHLNSSLLLL